MKNRCILKIRGGSHLYGLNTANSDEDFLGIYLSTEDELFGLEHSETIDASIVDKAENGRNTKDAVDCKYYELRNFCRLALKANPSILEILFANPENIIEVDEYGLELIKNRDLFLSSKVFHSYAGYAHSQMKKSQVKTENLKTLVEARKYLSKVQPSSKMLYDYVIDTGSMKEGKKYQVKEHLQRFLTLDNEFPNYVIIADLKFNNQKVNDVLRKIEDRIDKASHRAEGILERGVDTKFISHTIRLLLEAKELLTTGNICFPLKDREMLLDIKNGITDPTVVFDLADKLEAEMEPLYHSTVLPKRPKFHEANDLIISIYKKYLKEVAIQEEVATLQSLRESNAGWSNT